MYSLGNMAHMPYTEYEKQEFNMEPFVVEFYETVSSDRPAESFLNDLDIKMRNKLIMTRKVLQEQGNLLCEPYSKHLEDGIFEVRGKVGSDISRVLYFFYYGSMAAVLS